MPRMNEDLSASALRISVQSPHSADAQACLSAYYAELAARFEAGFDMQLAHNEPLDSLAAPAGWFLVARLDDAAVGCAGLRRIGERSGELKRMWIAPAARGRGVARALLAHIEDLARSAGFTEIKLDTNKALIEAHALYRSAGYQEIAPYNDNAYAHLWFAKTL
jgi:GNAT superfamily N-acetyltransferase